MTTFASSPPNAIDCLWQEHIPVGGFHEALQSIHALLLASEPQKASYEKLVQRYETPPARAYTAFYTNTLICEWPFITIGIEPDGYAHS